MSTPEPPGAALSQAGRVSFRNAAESWKAALNALEDHWRRGQSADLEAIWNRYDPSRDLTVLVALIKAELRQRFARGETPTVADYLDHFATLRETKDRVVSLVYEEYCLLEEKAQADATEPPDPSRFCARYEDWRDSLRSQLMYHRMLSQVLTGPEAEPVFPKRNDVYLGCRIVERLGRGGAASVFRAQEVDVGNRAVVLKLSADRGEEQNILGKLEHPHIVPILWAFPRDEQTGLRALCMPYRTGVTLDQVLPQLVKPAARRTALDLWEALRRALPHPAEAPECPPWPDFPVHGPYADAVAWLGWKLALALAHAHAIPIVHRDLKPANVLLTVREGPQLLDFNLAHDPNSPEQAETAMRGGTLPYMAPEQIEAFLDDQRWSAVRPPADLFALGLLLRELLTGQPPEAPSPNLPRARAIAELLDRRAQPLAPLRQLEPTVPHALGAILNRCSTASVDGRYPGAEALAEDLRRFLERRPPRHAQNPSLRERAANLVHRQRWPLVASVALILVLAGIMVAASGQYRLVSDPVAAFLAPRSTLVASLRPLKAFGPLQGQPDPDIARQSATSLAWLVSTHPQSLVARRAWRVVLCMTGETQLPAASATALDPSPGSPDLDEGIVPEESLARLLLEHAKGELKSLDNDRLQDSARTKCAQKASDALELARVFGPGNPDIHYNLARTCEFLDNNQAGFAYSGRAIALLRAPTSVDLKSSYGFLIVDCLRVRAVFALRHSETLQDGKLACLEGALKDTLEAGKELEAASPADRQKTEFAIAGANVSFTRAAALDMLAEVSEPTTAVGHRLAALDSLQNYLDLTRKTGAADPSNDSVSRDSSYEDLRNALLTGIVSDLERYWSGGGPEADLSPDAPWAENVGVP